MRKAEGNHDSKRKRNFYGIHLKISTKNETKVNSLTEKNAINYDWKYWGGEPVLGVQWGVGKYVLQKVLDGETCKGLILV